MSEKIATAFPDPRDELAIRIMFLMLEKGIGKFSDPNHLSYSSYRIADAMIAARKAGA